MTKRLDILKKSLEKKEAALQLLFDTHFATIKQANGQPLNDKANGAATLAKWERQNTAIRRQQAEVEKTQAAIESEEGKMCEAAWYYNRMPKVLTRLIDDGMLVQWYKHPHILFVKGVYKARIVYDMETREVAYRYLKEVTDRVQYAIFRDVYNGIRRELKG